MKKELLLTVFIIIVSFSGCVFLNKNSQNAIDKRLDSSVEKIIDSLETKDSELLKSVLSQNAYDSYDLQNGIDYLFNLINYENLTVKKLGCPIRDNYNSGIHKKWVDAAYVVYTQDGSSYFLDFVYYVIDENNPGNIGINTLKLSKNNHSADTYTSSDKYQRCGIYNPEWDTEN